MKRQTIALAASAVMLLTGCIVTSVHPYFSPKDAVYDPALLGQWTNTQSEERWVFQKAGSNAYNLTFISDGKTNLANVQLFKLNGQMFLDFVSADSECDVFPPPVPSHFLLRAHQLAPTIRLAPLNNDWLKALLERNPKALRHILIGDKADDRSVVLTAETQELQQFLRAHLDSEDAWKDSFELRRVAAQ